MDDEAQALQAERLRDAFLRYARVSTVIGNHEEKEVYTFAELLKRHLRQKCDTLVTECAHQPLLFCYAADATSLLCRADASAKLGTAVVMRRGKVLAELLMQRGFFKSISPAGVERVAVLFAEAVPLTKGKSAWHLFSAACAFYPLLRKVGHQGISITHVAADRAVMEPLQRLLHQRSEAYFTQGLGPAAGDCSSWLRTWHLRTGCAAHDMQNALKWSLAPHGNADIIKDLHIVLESMRNSFTLLHAQLPHFLRSHLVADLPPEDMESAMEFWQLLGVEADHLEEIAYVNPWFFDGALHVSSSLADEGDRLERVSGAILYLFRWRRFVDTRFCTIGAAMRSLLASLSVGCHELVNRARQEKDTTDYHLHGFTRLQQPHLEYIVLATVCAWVPEGALFLVLEDDRLVRRYDDLNETLMDELTLCGFLVLLHMVTLECLVKGFHAAPAAQVYCSACSASCLRLHSREGLGVAEGPIIFFVLQLLRNFVCISDRSNSFPAGASILAVSAVEPCYRRHRGELGRSLTGNRRA